MKGERVVLRRPPRIKYLEAAGALGDGRVRVVEEGPSRLRARVESSMGDKEYHVVIEWGEGTVEAYSDDNGTRYRGYVGYPILSLMMLAGLLKRDKEVEEALKGIPWKRLNEEYKRYKLVEEEVARIAQERGVARSRLEEFIRENTRRLQQYKVIYNPGLPAGGEERGTLLDYM